MFCLYKIIYIGKVNGNEGLVYQKTKGLSDIILLILLHS